MFRKMSSLLTALCLLAPLPGMAESFDAQKMQRDLGIAEGILSRLQAAEQWSPFAPQVRGLYLKGYGAIFLSQGSDMDLGDWAVFKALRGEGRRVEIVKRAYDKQLRYDEQQRYDKSDTSGRGFAEFKEQTAEFFRSYADAIGQLAEGDRITVLGGTLGNIPGGWMGGWGRGMGKRVKRLEGAARPAPADSAASAGEERTAEEIVRQGQAKAREAEELARQIEVELAQGEERTGVFFEATVKKSDLSAYRRGRLSEEDFQQRILYREHQPDPELAKKIDIMAGILEQSLAKGPRPGWGPVRNSSGVYCEGIGALFCVDGVGLERLFRPELEMRSRAWAMARRAEEADSSLSQLEAQAAEERAKLKEELISTVAEYGHTLRGLKPQEQVVVEVRFGTRPWGTPSTGRLLLRVRQEDIDAYRKGALDLEQFRRKAEIAE